MTFRKQKSKTPKRFVLPGAGVLAALAIVVGAIVLLRKRGRQFKGGALDATEAVRQGGRDYDDVTLARKVESEIFRDADAPKGKVVVNGRDGVIQLRGQVDSSEHAETLAKAAAGVTGVKDVENLLHVPGAQPTEAPVSDPQDVKDRLG